jgi:hypothetical protein
LGVATANTRGTRAELLGAIGLGALLEHRCLRDMHPFLRDIALRSRGDALAQRGAFLRRQVGAEQRRLAVRTFERLDDQLVEAVPGVVERSRLTQPPGRDRGQAQRLTEQLLAELRQVAQQRT